MSIITNEILKAVEKLESKYNPDLYINNIKVLEGENKLLQKDLDDLIEFESSELYKRANKTVKILVSGEVINILKNIKSNDKDIEKYFNWIVKYINENKIGDEKNAIKREN